MNNFNTYIEQNRLAVEFALSQFGIYDEPNQATVKSALDEYGSDFAQAMQKSVGQDRQIAAFGDDPYFIGPPEPDPPSGGGNAWSIINQIFGYGQQAADIWGQFKGGASGNNTVGNLPAQPNVTVTPVTPTGQASGSMTTPLIIGGIALVIIVVLIFLLKK